MNLVKSKQRVADHGEVFTPVRMVEAVGGFKSEVQHPGIQ